MKRDGRFEPLTVLAEIITVLGLGVGGLIAWIRHEKPEPTPPHVFRECKHVETPRATWRHP